jgi:galactokinase
LRFAAPRARKRKSLERAGGVIRVRAPGRVNLIGGHTDYAGGLVLPMAIDRATTITGERGGERVVLRSADEPEPADVPLAVDDPRSVTPGWARYVAAVVTELHAPAGFTGDVSTTIPIGTGLSSSAALEVAVALAVGAPPELATADLAELLRGAELRASGVPCGIMDQLTSLAGEAGHAILIDCTTLITRPVALATDLDVVIVDSGQRRQLANSGYADRRAQVAAAQELLGHLPAAQLADVEAIEDPLIRKRARHVVTENQRVLAFVDALAVDDRSLAGDIMLASHSSLRDNHEVTTPELDALVDRLCARPGVWGARLTGGGWGGSVVALTEHGALDEGERVVPSAGASVETV